MKNNPHKKPILILIMLIIGLLFAGTDASAMGSLKEEAQDCKECHQGYYSVWETSKHSQADPAIQCVTCHNPPAPAHPNTSMPIEQSDEKCGSCHTEIYADWAFSTHKELGFTCINCHTQHSAALKSDTPEALCERCHENNTKDLHLSAHGDSGLSCTDCHMTPHDPSDDQGTPDHSFSVKIADCSQCHADDFHTATVNPSSTDDDGSITEMQEQEAMGIADTPQPVSPIYFTLLAGLLGAGFGLIASPWLERWYKKVEWVDE